VIALCANVRLHTASISSPTWLSWRQEVEGSLVLIHVRPHLHGSAAGMALRAACPGRYMEFVISIPPASTAPAVLIYVRSRAAMAEIDEKKNSAGRANSWSAYAPNPGFGIPAHVVSRAIRRSSFV